MPAGPRFIRRLKERLLPPVPDARGRDIWPLLNRSLRERKWTLNGDRTYSDLLYPTRWHMVGVVLGVSLPAVVCMSASVVWMLSWIDQRALTAGRGATRLAVFGPITMAALTGIALGVLWFACWFRRTARSRIVPSYLARGMCGACLYQMGSPKMNDGVAACPECGSAWRLPVQ